MTGSPTGLQILCPQSLLVLVLRSPGGSGDDNELKLSGDGPNEQVEIVNFSVLNLDVVEVSLGFRALSVS